MLDVQPAGVVHTVGVPSRETLEAFASDEFLTGLTFGIGALLLGLVVAYLWRRRYSTPAPIVGLLLTAGVLGGLETTRGLPADLWIGLVLLAVAGALYPWARRVPLLAAVVAIPGAWWVTQVVELPGALWVPWLLFAWIVLGAPLVTSFDRHFQDRGYGPVLVAISIAGMFVTLPDTEEILVVFGVVAALVFLAWPKVLGSLGAVGIYPLLGVLAWVIAFDGRGRESAIIGAVAALGFLVVEPLARWWRGGTLLDRFPKRWWGAPVVGALHLVVVLLVARVAGLRETAASATVVAGVVLGVSMIVLAVLGPRTRTNRRQ